MPKGVSAELARFAEELADASREILGPAGKRRPDVEIKADASPVTVTDRAIETRLREMIVERYPEHGILGEEHGALNPDAEFVWAIDPIDGTLAFVAGVPVYGTLIGLAHEGEPVFGVIDHPATSDRWVGGPGLGARWNGVGVRTRRCASLAEAFLTSSNPDLYTSEELATFNRVRDAVQLTLYGGSCYSYGLLAGGRTDIALDSGLDIFDILAVAAVLEGAGGVLSDWGGGRIDLSFRGDIVAAGDAGVHAEALRILGAH